MLQCHKVERRFSGQGGEITALAGVNLTINQGEFVVIKGPSGCGKSTLLLTLGGMQRPSSGNVRFGDDDLYALAAPDRNRIRAERMGFVFQLFHLIPFLNVRENVLAGLPPGSHAADHLARADELIRELGLSHRSSQRPGTLSAGERQRVALARAMIKSPPLILADEPTGNLDPENAGEVFQHLANYRKQGGTVVVVTHGDDAAPYADRTIRLANGLIVEESQSREATSPTHS